MISKVCTAVMFLMLFFVSPSPVNACTVCMGGTSGPLGEAANGAIFVMLAALVFVLGLIAFAGYRLVKKSKMPLPPHAELARII